MLRRLAVAAAPVINLVCDAPADVSDAKGGKDMFGVEWTYVDAVGGAIPVPGNPLLENADEWTEKSRLSEYR